MLTRALSILAVLTGLFLLPVEAQETTSTDERAALDQQRFADGLMSRGLHDMAIAEYRKILSDHPDYSRLDEVLFRLGESYRKEKKGPFAERMYLRVVREFPESRYHDRAAFRRAELYVRNGKYLEAVNLMRAVMDSNPSEDIAASASYYAGYSMKRIALTGEAEQQFKKVLEKYSDSPYKAFAALELAGMYREDTRKLKQAKKMYETAAASEASDRVRAEALFQLGDLAYETKDYEEAVSAYTRLRESFPGDSRVNEAALQTGWSYFLTEKWDQLADLSGEHLGEDPVWIYFQANALRAENKAPQALEVYEEFLSKHPEHRLASSAGYEAALCWFAEGNHEQVIKQLESQSMDASDPLAKDRIWLLAQAQLNLDRTKDAGKMLQQFLELEPDTDRAAVARYELARQAQSSGDFASAADQFRALQEKHPKHDLAPQALYSAGYAMAAQENFAQAIKDWNIVIRKYPSSEFMPQAVFQKALAQVRLKRFPSAEKTLQKFLETGPSKEKEVEAAYWLAQVQEERGNMDAAKQTYTDALEKAGGHDREGSLRFRLAGVLQSMGDTDKAAKLYQEVLDSPEVKNMPPSLLEWLARQQLDKGGGSEAVKAAKALVDGQSDAAWKQIGLYLLGNAQVINGKDADARVSYAEAFTLEAKTPEGIEAGLVLGGLLVEDGKSEDAREVLLKVVERSREDDQLAQRAKATFLLGRVSEQMKDMESAARYFMSVAILYDDAELSPESLYRAAEAYGTLKAEKERSAAIKDLLARYPDSEWAKKINGE